MTGTPPRQMSEERRAVMMRMAQVSAMSTGLTYVYRCPRARLDLPSSSRLSRSTARGYEGDGLAVSG